MFFRNRRLARAVACWFLLQTVTALALPSVGWAMMGPSQPEFTSYEAPGATDLVNLTTGNFSYSIPVLDVPGPERSFSLPLSYRAGIQLEQEASWVGLGWSLNAGAISRTVNGYADDAAGEGVTSRFEKEVESVDNSVVIPGIYRQYDSKYNGTGGSVDLLGLASVNWDKNGLAGGDVVGISYQKGQGLNVDPVRMTLAAVSVATLGGSSAAAVAGNVGLGLAESVASSLITGAFSAGKLGGTSGYDNGAIDHTSGDYFESTRRIFFLNTATESQYGSLNFGKMSQRTSTNSNYNTIPGPGPAIRAGAGAGADPAPQFQASRRCDGNDFGNQAAETAADVYQQVGVDALSQGRSYYYGRSNPLSVAHDNFSVMGEGASGTIRPYRLDVGSIAYPKVGTSNCYQHAKYMVVPFKNDYKVGFRYENDLSNGYDYHQNGADIGFKISDDQQSLTMTDPRLFNAANRVESARKGLVNAGPSGQRLVQGKHTAWYSNAEIEHMTGQPFAGYANGFLDFAPPVAADGTPNAFRSQLPPDGIGAFAVTVADGSTYHYSLPVYEFVTYTQAHEQRSAATVGSLGKYTSGSGRYATTWLLTAITSPDYVDRNQSGTVDDADWGGWTKFTYGKFSSYYSWRQPYIGGTYSDDKEPFEYLSHTEGSREAYYLNTISTRTHTALFVKSVREDGRGSVNNSSGDDTHTGLASSLRLDEIILLDNAALHALQTPDGIRAAGEATPTPALTNNTSANATALSSGDDLGQVLDEQDFAADGRMRKYVNAHASKRIRFTYGYDLCRGTPNSFAYDPGQPDKLPPMDEGRAAVNRGGKLTLKSVSFFGPTVDQKPTKITPDFVFGYEAAGHSVYETNPAYGKEKWDAFGMYTALGVKNTTSHRPALAAYGAPWCLTTITSPLGGVTTVEYERDEYAHVSDYGTKPVAFSFDGTSKTLTLSADELRKYGGSLLDAIHPNDVLRFTGELSYNCNYASPRETANATLEFVDRPLQVVAVTANSISFAKDFEIQCDGINPDIQGGSLTTSLPSNTPGGDVRVAAITTADGETGARYQVRYRYTDGTTGAGNSTGVLAKEPTFLDKATKIPHSFDNQFDYPSTPVLYKQVTVLRGPFRNNDAGLYNSREVYTFYTPTADMVTEKLTTTGTGNRLTSSGGSIYNNVLFFNNQVTVNTGLVGRPKAVATYNQRGQQELSTEFTYANQVANADGVANQGHFSEGVLNNEMLYQNSYHVNRTTKEYIPAVLVGSRSTRNGLSITNRNVLYDFYTGQVLETAFTNSQGKVYHARSVPAYTLPGNEGMGAKGDDPANHHMLAQQGASYAYTEIPGGPAYNPQNPLNPNTSHILSAGVQTWRSAWANYREADANGTYQDAAGQVPVWRQAAAYAWQSPKLAADGSFQDFAPFNWTGASDSHWLKAAETVRYDHYSHALETRDVNGQSAAQKTGYDQTQLIAAAANARYTELAYSGAEDQLTVAGATQFGGEVVAGGTPDNQKAHTGFFSNQLAAGQKGFVYRAQAGRDVDLGKTYRVTAWVSADAPAGKLYVAVNGNRLPESALVSQSRKKAGAWSLLSALVTVPASANGQLVEFGCVNDGASPANFDDFRVAPLTAAATSSVYDPRTNHLLYALDNNNLYSRYEYTPTGRLLRVYQETLDRPGDNSLTEKKVKEYDYNFARLYFPTWMSTAYRCQTNAAGNPNGYEERQVVDVNPLNNPPTPPKWELNGYSLVCVPPACNSTDDHPSKLINGVCEEAQQNKPDRSEPCVMGNGSGGYYTIHYWIFSDGSTYESQSNCTDQLAPTQ